MKVKRIVSLVFALGLLSTTAITSALALSGTYQHYGQTYNYSGTLNELGYSATGTLGASPKAISSSANFTNYSRYIETSVGKYRYSDNALLADDFDSKSTSYGGVGATINRNTGKAFYYKHTGCLKPYAGSSYTIDSYTITVLQKSST